MKKINFKLNVYSALMSFLVLLAYLICASACTQNVDPKNVYPQNDGLKNGVGVSNKISSITSVQDLPGGKERFTWVNGNFDTNGYTWERIWQLSFTTSGTVGAIVWTWKSPNEVGKVPFSAHVCTMEGLTKTCNAYTPYGWCFPAGQYESWTGTYVYNTTTGKLDITWATPSFAAGAQESWTITNPTPALARASLLSSTYSLTHGRGYGSHSLFSTFKTITQIVSDGLPNFSNATSKAVSAKAVNEVSAPVITPSSAAFNTWDAGVMNLSGANTPSSPSPANTLHFRSFTTGTGVNCSCTTTRPGFVYHLSSNNNGRGMSFTMWCACLPTDGEFPCYDRFLHPFALYQVLDDNNDLVALIGGEIQNEAGSAGYLFSLQDYNNIP
ncbi:hypothetical protein [Pedobacter heparinus]|uniref:hypothetical protein n=1 Tax=Pedobacter heparinus TaxID=984 RepID=UPI00292E2C5C|nr:hypothetical protein [Pedobacter heparinus]